MKSLLKKNSLESSFIQILKGIFKVNNTNNIKDTDKKTTGIG